MSKAADRTFVLAGNPNVGKSTVFNAFARLNQKQHTGNWAGKTVSCAETCFHKNGKLFRLVDLPGTYSLSYRSPEEKAAVDFLRQGTFDAVICVADCCTLNRGISLLLQILELTKKVVFCVNLMDEAKKRGIVLDDKKLSFLLGVPVVCIEAKSKKGLQNLFETALSVSRSAPTSVMHPLYPKKVNAAVQQLLPHIPDQTPRYTALQMLTLSPDTLPAAYQTIAKHLLSQDHDLPCLIEAAPMQTANRLTACVISQMPDPKGKTLPERIFTGKVCGKITMLLLLFVILWLTVSGAGYLSDVLLFYFSALKPLVLSLTSGLPPMLAGLLCDGIFEVITFVVSVMLPPLVIFFPLFTWLEEFGYLPRLAYNLDPVFCKAGTGGKQALTVCMGFGCNALGITGCRIIDSKRERDIAMLTNPFTPCNGRLPLLISIFSLFLFRGENTLATAACLTLILLFSFAMTFLSTWILSKTVCKGKNSSFTLELPGFRKPKLSKILFSGIIEKTLHILSRAVICALFAGIIIWFAANLSLGGTTLLSHVTDLLDPIGKFFGMDGVILTAFLLGLPANETVMPIILMAYTDSGAPITSGITDLFSILTQNGWTVSTAVCVLLFTLMHWPCATSILTLYKESKSISKTVFGILLPTVFGLLSCLTARMILSLFV